MNSRVSILVIALTFLLAACGGTPPEPQVQAQNDIANTNAQPTQQPAAPAESDSQGAVATVNGVPISTDSYNDLLIRRSQDSNFADDSALSTFVLNTLINEELIRQAAQRMEITVTDADVDAEINELKALLGNDDAAWQAWLQENSYTEAFLRNELRTQLLTATVRDSVVGDTPQQVQRQVHARHILVETEAEAQQIRQRILNGENFVELAAQHSKDVTTRNEGGDLGWFTEEELLEPVVAQTAFAQEAGGISEPVATRLGFHIVETLQFDELPLQPEKQAEVAQGIFDEWLITQYDSAIIEIYTG